MFSYCLNIIIALDLLSYTFSLRKLLFTKETYSKLIIFYLTSYLYSYFCQESTYYNDGSDKKGLAIVLNLYNYRPYCFTTLMIVKNGVLIQQLALEKK